ncbi:hypothetical protein KJ564_09950, partial [bacterium]|nr:hypothetical protein [bacterium]
QQVWSRTFGGSVNEEGFSVEQTFDGGFLIGGYTTSYDPNHRDIYVVKTDLDGNLSWDFQIGGEDYDMGTCALQTSDGGFAALGYTECYGAGLYDIYLIRLDDQLNFDPPLNRVPLVLSLHPPHPNPFNPTTTITFDLPVASQVTFDVFDINGRYVGAQHAAPMSGSGTIPTTGFYPPGTHSIIFDGSGLSSGVYLYRLETSGSGATIGTGTPTIRYGKMVLLK